MRRRSAPTSGWSRGRRRGCATHSRPILAEHQSLRFDPEARNLRHTYVTGTAEQPVWRVQQVLVDAEMVNDWVAEFEVDVVASGRGSNRCCG